MRTLVVAIALLVCSMDACISQTEGFEVVGTPTANKTPNIATVIIKSQQFLKKTQNPDGSWTSGPKSSTSTALALSAFLRMGDSRSSVGFGSTITRAHSWLLAVHPESANESVAITVALSDYFTVHADTSTAIRVAAILENTDAPTDVMWVDILSAARIPDERQRPQWCLRKMRLEEKEALPTNNVLPATVSDYLSAYAMGRRRLLSGRQRPSERYHFLVTSLLKLQQDDGSFPVKDEEDKIAATALVLLCVSDFHRAAFRFCPPKEIKGPKPVGQAVNINL